MNDDALEALLQHLRDARGFDFTGYKRASLRRRIAKRMSDVGIEEIEKYLDYLQAQPDEFAHLFNTILINVTRFFRDPESWKELKTQVLPTIIGDPGSTEPIRIWSAGCASGEEAYTLAIMLAIALGDESYRRRVKIYGTDIDEDALAQARQATFAESDVKVLSEETRARFFERTGTRYILKPDYRRSVIFGRHDLIQDAPIARMDLISCRNVLMYFNAGTQARILANLHFALKETGFLFLGRAEMMLSHSDQFEIVDLSQRIFRKRPSPDRRRIAPVRDTIGPTDGVNIWSSALDGLPIASMLLDPAGHLLLANRQARLLFGLSERDTGKPFKDLEISYRPFELRSPVQDAIAGRKPIILRDLERNVPKGTQHFDLHVDPVIGRDGGVAGIAIHLVDRTDYSRLQAEHLRASQELETAYEELQSTNEELETTNEELQSTVEELETTNEELQSTNEELETMNEELQSTNAELQAVNDEYQRADAELRALNRFMGAVLTSIHTGLIVLNERLEILAWNQHAEELWGMRSEEVRGLQIMDLDIGLPVTELRAPIVACLTGSTEERVELRAINRRGKTITVAVTVTPLLTAADGITEVVLLMEDSDAPS